MSYIAQSDLDVYSSDEVLKRLTDDANAGAIDTAKVAECIAAAEGEVNSFLASRYTVPITGTVPEIVKEWCVQLATLRLHQRRLRVPDDVWTMAVEARRQLGLVAKGDISLEIGTDPPDTPSSRAASFQTNTRVFSRTLMRDW